MESSPSDSVTLASKEAAALSSLAAESFPQPVRRRMRRRRRSLRRRIVDALTPFCIVAGLTIFAGGMVQLVEVGAAGQSKSRRSHATLRVEVGPPPSLRAQLAKNKYQNTRRDRPIAVRNDSMHQIQVSNQIAFPMEAQRSLVEMFATPKRTSGSVNDIVDWGLLFEPGSEDPRSTLQRGTAQR
ncbi:MAG: hypothetical protein IH881_04780 [Myxococcales bacterium]|nr:hypothetical protein [Myxococcales bacterium]